MLVVEMTDEIRLILNVRAEIHYELEDSLPLYLHEPYQVIPSERTFEKDVTAFRQMREDRREAKKQAILDKFAFMNKENK